MVEERAASIARICGQYGRDPSRLMDIAREVQARYGHISEENIALIADALGIHRVEVRDTVTFYAHWSTKPMGRYVVRLCNAVVERMKGADAVARAFEQAVGVSFGETSSDGLISLTYTPCIGMSDQAPSALINGVVLTNLQPEDAGEIVAAMRVGGDLRLLPQAGIYPNINQGGEVVLAPIRRGAAINAALARTPEAVVEEVRLSRLRGRGGAGFPTAKKWESCLRTPADIHYVVCNADEGEPGTFKDRVILTENPNLVFEGMTVAAYAIGAKEGILYLRGEYEYMLSSLQRVLAKRRHLGLLGKNICGKAGFDFDIRIQLGAGAYVCGEESALIESLEGKRGAPRERPPFPVQRGYKDKPSIVNNVVTFCCAARILEKGAAWFASKGTPESTGTKLLSVSGDCEHPGVFEVEHGIRVREVLYMAGAEQAQAVQVGGPSGQCISPKEFDRRISFEDLPTGGSIMVFGPERDVLQNMLYFCEFFADESCGWCAPCRIGTTLQVELMQKVVQGQATRHDLDTLTQLGRMMRTMGRCGLGQTAANPVLTSMRNFPELYEARLRPESEGPYFDLEAALADGCALTGRTPTLEHAHHG